MSRQCFLAQEAADARVGQELSLPAAEARHASVKRVGVGEEIDVVDGAGTRATCRVDAAAPDLRLIVTAVEHDPAPTVRTRLVQALAKGDRDLQAVETCVEIGVDAITPWQAERSIVRWKGERAAKAHAKWAAQVTSAVKQSRRSRLPEVADLVDSAGLVRTTKEVTEAGGLVLVLHEEATATPADVVGPWLSESALALRAEVCLVVGPEGGISPHELEELTAAGAHAVLVGEHVLRASTAGAVGLVLVRAALGHYH